MTGTDDRAPPVLRPVGDGALLVEFENRISPETNRRVLTLARSLIERPPDGVLEVAPAYRSLLIQFDPLKLTFDELCARLVATQENLTEDRQAGKHWRVPVFYGGNAAPDLTAVAERHGLSEEQVIDIHSRSVYRVYMVGFAPGWTFLGELDPRLHTPRLATPRDEAPAGCISIGGQQTLIGGQAMPSGWNLIGQTPERSFAPERSEPFFLAPGDEVSIRRIDRAEFHALSERAASGQRVSEEIEGA